uniref:RNA-directed DNA polymerase, eukaryota n=1 Tax=Tanacetum cinerariifolium TaxID=118510 RepID=A0A6L2L3M2_TANCI|nr:hypothetical protein [Tanacetum cinerariifolium]
MVDLNLIYAFCGSEIVSLREQSDKSDLDSEQSVEGFNEDIDGSEEEQQGEDDLSVVQDTLDTDVRINGDEGAESKEVNEKQSTDPFGFYSLLKKRRRKEKNESSNKESLQFPLGFTPRDEGECNDSVHDNNAPVEVNSANLRDNRTKKDGMASVGSGHIQKVEVPRTGGSILSLMDELNKVGQTIGYKMDGCIKNIEEIVELQRVDDMF